MVIYNADEIILVMNMTMNITSVVMMFDDYYIHFKINGIPCKMIRS